MRRKGLCQPAVRLFPDEGDLLQRLVFEHLDAFGNVATASAGIEGERIVIVFQGPDDQPLEPMVGQLLPRGSKQPASKPDTLVFGAKVEFVDFALLPELLRTVPAERGIARNPAPDLDHQDRGGASDGIRPPVRATPVYHRCQRPVRNDAGIGAAPRLEMHLGDLLRVARLGPPDVDGHRIHDLLTIDPAQAIARMMEGAGVDYADLPKDAGVWARLNSRPDGRPVRWRPRVKPENARPARGRPHRSPERSHRPTGRWPPARRGCGLSRPRHPAPRGRLCPHRRLPQRNARPA